MRYLLNLTTATLRYQGRFTLPPYGKKGCCRRVPDPLADSAAVQQRVRQGKAAVLSHADAMSVIQGNWRRPEPAADLSGCTFDNEKVQRELDKYVPEPLVLEDVAPAAPEEPAAEDVWSWFTPEQFGGLGKAADMKEYLDILGVPAAEISRRSKSAMLEEYAARYNELFPERS